MNLPKPFYEAYYCINCGASMKGKHYKQGTTCSDNCKDSLNEIRSMIDARKDVEKKHPKRESARRIKQYYLHQ